MKRILNLYFLLFLSSFSLWGQTGGKDDDKFDLVQISTSHGDMTLFLYSKTVKHRENFLKLVREKFYDSTTFHRCIQRFMVQGGDINSKDKDPNNDGQGDMGYTIPAEIFPEYYHKKGAVAGARLGDNVNPGRASSGSQFYIVEGQTFDKASIERMPQSIFSQDYMMKPEAAWIRQVDWAKLQKEYPDSLSKMQQKIQKDIAAAYDKVKDKYAIPAKAADDYATLGGTPHLDKGYTVFGEVIEGLDVVSKISGVEKVANGDRPKEPVYMKAKIITVTRKELREKYKFTNTI
jgi:cyclophilin family peptidyl-prolyl cis-trans isomerase